jgi:hypothetical protein
MLFENDVPYTYFITEVSAYEPVGLSGQVEATTFQQRPVALFLEGPTHYIRGYPDQAETVYEGVRQSGIYDEVLNTYKVCSSLEEESYELGRIKAYPSGWIENESIYTHMQYKWLLELLRAGLHEQFFEEIKTAFPPFLDPAVYGRSTLENCSFIASSAHPDSSIHGQGFQPRFSGVTAEFINIWLLMTVGERPFSLDNEGKLQFHLAPTLPGWMFTNEEKVIRYWNQDSGWEQISIPAHSFAFNFLENTLVLYSNPRRSATFGQDGVKVKSYRFTYLNGENCEIQGGTVGSPIAEDIRKKRIRRIETLLA